MARSGLGSSYLPNRQQHQQGANSVSIPRFSQTTILLMFPEGCITLMFIFPLRLNDGSNLNYVLSGPEWRIPQYFTETTQSNF
jgi:hypothetical protein